MIGLVQKKQNDETSEIEKTKKAANEINKNNEILAACAAKKAKIIPADFDQVRANIYT